MTATTILHALRHRHNTKSGTWGKMTILSGELKFYELKEDGQVIAEHVFNCEINLHLLNHKPGIRLLLFLKILNSILSSTVKKRIY